jgi:hypothetical protein
MDTTARPTMSRAPARYHVASAPRGTGRLPLWVAAPIVLTVSLFLWFMIWLFVEYVL